MNTYPVDVRSILEDTGGSVSIDDTFDLPVLVVGDESFTLREPASFYVTISNAGTGIVAYGTITAQVKATCSRCLCEYDDEIAGEVEGVWARSGQQTLGDEGTGEVDSEGRIDLAPALIAALVIEAPFAPLHDEACKGLCATCGADLNVETCACGQQPAADHPFSALAGLLGEQDDTAEND